MSVAFQRAQARARLTRGDHVALPREEGQRVLDRRDRVGPFPRELQDPAEIHKGLPLGIDVIRTLDDATRLTPKGLRGLRYAFAREQLRANRPPKELGRDIVRSGDLLARVRERERFLVAAAAVENFCQPASGRRTVVSLAHLLERLVVSS